VIVHEQLGLPDVGLFIAGQAREDVLDRAAETTRAFALLDMLRQQPPILFNPNTMALIRKLAKLTRQDRETLAERARLSGELRRRVVVEAFDWAEGHGDFVRHFTTRNIGWVFRFLLEEVVVYQHFRLRRCDAPRDPGRRALHELLGDCREAELHVRDCLRDLLKGNGRFSQWGMERRGRALRRVVYGRRRPQARIQDYVRAALEEPAFADSPQCGRLTFGTERRRVCRECERKRSDWDRDRPGDKYRNLVKRADLFARDMGYMPGEAADGRESVARGK
jgi:hypothetical protein